MGFSILLKEISERYQNLLGENLVGIYIHGSIAFGCFNWDRSDIDFLVVVNDPVSQPTKLQLLQVLEELREKAPPNGFEMSVVLKSFCKNFEYPTPYELHFSNIWLEKYLEKPISLCDGSLKTDYDLAAHFTVILHTGIVLCGQPIADVFRGVPSEYYLDSIRRDVEDARDDVTDNPVYAVLNLCRVYAYIKDGTILSKEAGGLWGMNNLPRQYHSLISAVMDDYKESVPFIGHNSELISFCEYMTDFIFNNAA